MKACLFVFGVLFGCLLVAAEKDDEHDDREHLGTYDDYNRYGGKYNDGYGDKYDGKDRHGYRGGVGRGRLLGHGGFGKLEGWGKDRLNSYQDGMHNLLRNIKSLDKHDQLDNLNLHENHNLRDHLNWDGKGYPINHEDIVEDVVNIASVKNH